MQVTRYLHTAILVSDLERSERFYSEILGLPKVDRSMKFPGIWYQIGEFQLHLIQLEGTEEALDNPEKWGRNRHIAFAVRDLSDIRQALMDAGYPVQASASGRAALFVRDPDGNVVELSGT
ncbi:MAG: VOC family protein [Cyanobacteria bacterium SID2]|nr:VOC family protein [Cyanobacteria bacterium SID2]MBP0005952.1 VOC family protein [Cyanobacteria bacterium SBC]